MREKVFYEGIWDTMRGHAARHGINGNNLDQRVYRYGKTPDVYCLLFCEGRPSARRYTIDGIRATVVEHARRIGISTNVIYQRVHRGMTTYEALIAGKEMRSHGYRRLTFKGETHNIAEWGRRIGVMPRTIGNRLKKGATVAQALCPTRWNVKATRDERTKHRKSRRSRELAALGIIV